MYNICVCINITVNQIHSMKLNFTSQIFCLFLFLFYFILCSLAVRFVWLSTSYIYIYLNVGFISITIGQFMLCDDVYCLLTILIVHFYLIYRTLIESQRTFMHNAFVYIPFYAFAYEFPICFNIAFICILSYMLIKN